MNKPIQLNSLYTDKGLSSETVRPTGFEELGGVLKVCYHRVTNGLAEDMAKFMPVEDFRARYELLQPQFKAPWVVHFYKTKPTVVSYNGQAVGHLAHLDVLYTRDGSPRIFMEVESPCVAIEDECGHVVEPPDQTAADRLARCERSGPDECEHASVKVAFDPERAQKMNQYEIREAFPRFEGICPDCGEKLIKYASYEHYICGDW